MKCSSSLKKSWTLSSSKRALESVYKLSPLVTVRKPVDSVIGFWRGRDGLYVLFDVANTEPSGRSGKRIFCSLGKEKINLKCELKLRSSARLRCTRDEFAYCNGNIVCLVTKVVKCFCKDLVRKVMCVCLYRRATARAQGRWIMTAGRLPQDEFLTLWVLLRVRETCNCCQSKSGNHVRSFPRALWEECFWGISSFSRLLPSISMRGFQRQGRTSVITFHRAAGERNLTLFFELGMFCPFLVNISEENICGSFSAENVFSYLYLQIQIRWQHQAFPRKLMPVWQGFILAVYTPTCCHNFVAIGSDGVWQVSNAPAWVNVVQTEALCKLWLSPLSHS